MKEFFKRRLIRLHPMIIMGMIIGAVTYYAQSSKAFPTIETVPVVKMLLVMIIGFTLLPVPPSMDIRGWNEMHPLNGPAWSLFFEYIANILYGLLIRKFSNRMLSIFVFIAGCALIHMALTSPHGDIIGGWSIEPSQLRIGFTRLLYPFFAGLLLSRICKPGSIRHAFLWCSLILIVVLVIPKVGGENHVWINGLYDALCIIFVFPVIVYLGASGTVQGKYSSRINKFLGDISYPIYIVHYPFIYLFMAWVAKYKSFLNEETSEAYFALFVTASVVLITSITVAYLCVKMYDIPVRKWLAKRFMSHPEQ
jgi:Predicted acyltransferases